MSLYDDARALALVSTEQAGPYCLIAEVNVMGLNVVSMSTGLCFYGISAGGEPPPEPEGELSRVYPGMVRVYPGIVRVYPT